MSTSIDAWLAASCADAERRGLNELKPLLESLARSMAALRAADAELDAEDRREVTAGDVSAGERSES